LQQGFDSLIYNANNQSQRYASPPQFASLLDAKMANQFDRHGITWGSGPDQDKYGPPSGNRMFGTPPQGPGQIPDSGQDTGGMFGIAPGGVSAGPASGRGGMGGGAGSGGDINSEYQFRQLGSGGQAGGGIPDWLQQNPANQGSMTGLNIADSGGTIGAVLAALLGLPGGRALGNYFGDRYINNNIFENDWVGDGPAPGPPAGPLDEFYQQVDDNDPRTWGALSSGMGLGDIGRFGNATYGGGGDFSRNWARAPGTRIGGFNYGQIIPVPIASN